MSFIDPSIVYRVSDRGIRYLINDYITIRGGLPPCNCDPNDQVCYGTHACIEVGVLTKLDRNMLSEEDKKKFDAIRNGLDNQLRLFYNAIRDLRMVLVYNPDNWGARNDLPILELFYNEISYLLL